MNEKAVTIVLGGDDALLLQGTLRLHRDRFVQADNEVMLAVLDRVENALEVARKTPREENLREAVLAWCEADKLATESFNQALEAINRELDAVGGYATTSALRGYCKSFYRMQDGFGGGVEREGERYGGAGPHADTVAPYQPEVGDRCFEHDMRCRDLSLKATAARNKVEEIAAELLGGLPSDVTPAAVSVAARALVLSDLEGP